MSSTQPPVRILLLEDSEIDAELITRQLEKMAQPPHIERAAIRREFEMLLEAGHFDLVLSDYSLPGFNGIDALRIARAQDPNLPFVFVSGVLGEEFATEALRAGATDYVTKKNLSRLAMVVDRAIVEAVERRERRRATEALKESEQRFRLMADTAPALIWQIGPDGRFVFANARFASEFQIPPSRMVEEGWSCLVQEQDWPEFEALRERAIAQRSIFQIDVRVRNGAGQERWLRCESRPLRSADGSFRGFVGCGIDVTEAKRSRDMLEAEVEARTEELRVKEEALRQAQKMEAVGQLTGGIAHDFNNMLAGIIGSAGLLRKRLREGRYDECDRYVEAVVSSANSAASLTQRLLAFSRRQTLDLQPTSVEGRISSLEEMLRRTLGPSVSLTTRFERDLWLTLTDANQFESAIINLAINARDAMPDGGNLDIVAENARIRAGDGASAAKVRPGDYIRITIADTGSGMDEDTLSKAIDPFFTTKPIGQGTGLGLSMVYGFMSQTGGHLDIVSRIGRGTTVSLLLPRADSAGSERPAAAAFIETAAQESPGKIYVVEDEPIIRMLVVDHLEELGYEVVEASSAEQALPSLRDDPSIDLLLTDVGLPGMNGRQLAEEVRKVRPGLAILFATGYAEGANSRSDLVGENMDLISKPFDVDDLAGRVGALLSRSP